jgi:hypothetical protein
VYFNRQRLHSTCIAPPTSTTGRTGRQQSSITLVATNRGSSKRWPGHQVFASLKQSRTSESWKQVSNRPQVHHHHQRLRQPLATLKEQFLKTSFITKNLTAVKDHCFLPLTNDEVTPAPATPKRLSPSPSGSAPPPSAFPPTAHKSMGHRAQQVGTVIGEPGRAAPATCPSWSVAAAAAEKTKPSRRRPPSRQKGFP